MKTDCLIIGFNDYPFEDYVTMVRSMGENSGAFQDLNLAFVEYEGRPYHAMGLLNRFYFENKSGPQRRLHNADFLWPTITYLGTYLWRRGLSFDYINLFQFEKERLKEKLLNDDILSVAITTTLYVSPHPILEIIAFIRQYNDRVKIVLGGPYVQNQTRMLDADRVQELLTYLGADFYVSSSEGELALVNIIRALRQGSSFDAIDNIAYRTATGYTLTAVSAERNPLEENMVNYALFPKEVIGEFVSTTTSKSCPFSCSFCGFPQRAGEYTYLSVDRVEQELNALRDLGTVTTLTFLDDTFNVPRPRFREILRMMIRNNYGFKWNSFYRSDHGDAETIELMAKAGCEGVFLGVESGSDAMLKRMNKTARRKHYLQAVPLLNAAGISTHASVIIGFPGETLDTVAETISLIEEARPETYRAQLWYCDPITPIWDQRADYQIAGSAFSWSHATMDYQTAADLVDRMFVCIENSIWMPQAGFEPWSLFYLQRKGMTLEQIKTYLRYFNTAVKQKLLAKGKTDLPPELVEGLRRSAQFDRGAAPDARPIEIYSGARYMAAETYWVEEFKGCNGASQLEKIGGTPSAGDPAWTVARLDLSQAILDSLQSRSGAEVMSLSLAAYSALLSRLSGEEETVILAAPQADGELVPLRLYPAWDSRFSEFAPQVERKLQEALEHGAYGLGILTNPLRLAPFGGTCPLFDAGFVFSGERGEIGPAVVDEILHTHPKLREHLGLILEVVAHRGRAEMQLIYSKNALAPHVVEAMALYLAQILEEVLTDPDARLGELMLGAEKQTLLSPLESDASEAFVF